MQFLSLFAGIGGFDLGLERSGMECVGQVENDPYCIRVLEKHWPDVKRLADIKDVKGDEFGPVDLICGGFPCTDISIAKAKWGRKGLDGKQSGLWTEYIRIIGYVRPAFAVVENVTALLSGPTGQPGRWFGRVLADLAEIGYDAEWDCIPASYIGAWHRRDRVWLVAYPDSTGRLKGCAEGPILGQSDLSGTAPRVASGWPGRSQLPQPLACRGHNGLRPRLHALGNAVVPQIPEIIGRCILEAEGRQ